MQKQQKTRSLRIANMHIPSHILMGIWTLVAGFPIYLLLINSLKTKKAIYANPFGLPSEWTLDNYAGVVEGGNFFRYFANSTLVVVVSLFMILFLGSLAAYALAHWKGKMSRAIFFFFLLGITASFPIMDLSELKPLWPEWKPLLSGVFFVADWPFAQLLILAFFFPLVQGLKEKKKAFIGWYLLAVAILIFEDLQVISILGQELAEISRFPLLKVNRLTGFGEFRRVELFFFILWFIVGFTALTVYYQGLVLNLKELLRLENPRPLILPLGLFLMVFTSYMYPSDLNYITTRLRYVPFYTISVNLLYLTIIFIAASLSKRRLSRHSRGEG